jgi:hypothetical protein
MKILNDIAYNLNWILIWLNSKFKYYEIQVSLNVFEFNLIKIQLSWILIQVACNVIQYPSTLPNSTLIKWFSEMLKFSEIYFFQIKKYCEG